jgi:AcrR family transcriptional regulator
VSKGLGYAYFEDVEEVAIALWDREVAQVYQRVEQATAGAGGLEQGLRRAVHAYFDVIEEGGALLGALQTHFGGSRMERRTRRRVRAFLEFWTQQVQRAAPLEPPAATALAAMMVNAADAAARVWGAGMIGREEGERLCVRFLVSGFRGALGDPALSRRS